MKTKKISYKSVSDILSPKELKNIKGGSEYYRCEFENGGCKLTETVWDCWEQGGYVNGIGGNC